MADGANRSLEDMSGKYLTFQLAGEVYGLEIIKVQELIVLMEITSVPRMPGFVRGVINLRGKVIPVVDLRLKFGLEATEDTEKTCVIVVRVAQGDGAVTMGVLVDGVSEVLDIEEDHIELPPELGLSAETNFVLAMAKIGQNVVMLLDVDRMLTGEDIKQTSVQ